LKEKNNSHNTRQSEIKRYEWPQAEQHAKHVRPQDQDVLQPSAKGKPNDDIHDVFCPLPSWTYLLLPPQPPKPTPL